MATETSQLLLDDLPPRGLEGHYYSAEHFDIELERFWRPEWRFVCHESEIARRGNYFRYDLGGDSVIVVRGDRGEIGAFHNVCRHRGSPVTREQRGLCPGRLVCPYHGWAYGLDGTLITAPKMHDDFDPTGWNLKRVWIEVWNGFVFISLAPKQPASIALRLARADFSAYDLEHLRVGLERDYIVEANWKVLWDNGLDCYHCALNHPQMMQYVPVDDYGDQLNAREVAEFDYIPDRPNLPDVVRKGGGRDIMRKHGSQATGCTTFQWHTGVFELFAYSDLVLATGFRPLSPTTTAVRMIQLVHADAVSGVDYTDAAFYSHKLVREQDNELCALVQRGMLSHGYEPGPYNLRLEAANRMFAHIYRESLRG